MLDSLNALIPVFVIIALGFALKARDFPGNAFWAPAEKLVYWVMFPALLINNTASADLSGLGIAAIAAVLLGALGTLGLFVLILARVIGLGGPQTSSFLQGSVRSNAYLGIAAVQAVYGTDGLALVGLVVTIIVPTVNFLSVLTLMLTDQRKPDPRALVMGVLSNPLILACITGFTLNASGVVLPEMVTRLLVIMGAGALPLGLLSVGAGLVFGELRGHAVLIGVTAGFKLLALPLAVAFGFHLLGVTGPIVPVALLFMSMPIAPSAYVLARLLGGDAALLAGMITATTLLAMITVPLVDGLITMIWPL